ncbi:ABC transporter ATP-binding protein [Gilvimarinus sp. F26214L]|uniref:ABC transporter ATP-binding protein n=1 Tax=Gilvimarinus sp. DZF01 TaxID=3461371 RepID=UPI0040466E2F
MIEVSRVHKRFGSLVAVEEVSFSIAPGEIVGLLGPNGAGKTTTMRIVSGLVRPTSGSVRVGGVDVTRAPQEVQRRLGVMPDGGGLYKRLTARENIIYFGRLQGLKGAALSARVAELTELLGMDSIINRPALGFSHGERTKVALARAIVHQPDYVLLDEPTNGLDVLTTRAVRRLLLSLKEQGKAVVFSSHLMHEVGHLCDRIVIVAGGRVAAEGTIDDLLVRSGRRNIEDAFIHLAYGPRALQEELDG